MIIRQYIQMGVIQTSENPDFVYENYEIVRQQNEHKILEEKKTGAQFILKQQSYLNKADYDRNFRKIREKEKEARTSENILKMVKLWSKEHNGVCSDIFKIYTVFEYPKIKLIDEIEARKFESKLFEEPELLSILQSCLSAFILEPSYLNLSPELIFIVPEGVLKVINTDLTDPNYLTVYNSSYYYSPQKINDFQKTNLRTDEREKESIFSIGMTILHSALLQNPSMCYEISLKRFNRKKLEHLIQRFSQRYSQQLTQLIFSMLRVEPCERINFYELKESLKQLCSMSLSINSFMDNEQSIDKNQFVKPIELKCSDGPLNTNKKVQPTSIEDLANNINASSMTLSSFANPIRKSEFEIIIDQQSRNSASNLSQALSKRKGKDLERFKQNIFTDNHIMDMIKQGLQKIQKTKSERYTLKQIKNSSSCQAKPIPVSSSQDFFSQYELITTSKQKDCVYLVQQYEDNSRYEGMTQSGMKYGHGKLIYPDGVFYEGNFKNDNLSGKGALYYGSNRPAYIGDWENNKFNGFGTLFNEYSTLIETSFDYSDFNKIDDQWVKFQGNFKQDIKQGLGKILLTNGETIEALFSSGVINGEGIFTDVNGKKIRGIWSGNMLQKIIE